MVKRLDFCCVDDFGYEVPAHRSVNDYGGYVEYEEYQKLEQENERLGKSWIAMEKRERATDKAIDELREEANELVSALREEVSALENILNSIIEVYAGMEGFEPQTAPEAYCLRIIEQMYKAALEGESDG